MQGPHQWKGLSIQAEHHDSGMGGVGGRGWWDHAEEKSRKMEAFCFWSKKVFLEGNLDNIWLSGLS